MLRALSLAQPGSAPAQYELALALSAAGEGAASTAALRRAVALDPELAGAWRALADQLRLAGDAAGADAAYAQHIRASVRDPALMAAARALCDERLGEAERLMQGPPEDRADRRRGDPHAGRARRPHRPLRATPRRCWRAAWSWPRASPARGTT